MVGSEQLGIVVMSHSGADSGGCVWAWVSGGFGYGGGWLDVRVVSKWDEWVQVDDALA